MCTRILWTADNHPVIVGRNMDWFESMQESLWVMPCGVGRDGLAGSNPLTWTAKYGSLVTVGYNAGATDGINEAGLSTSLLYLVESDYGTRDARRPGLAISLWCQYFLDNFATVAEATAFMGATDIQILPSTIGDTATKPASVHLALADKTGDSAIIEYLDGKAHVHHGHEFTVMTNSPPYDEQLVRLHQYAGFGGDTALPGTTEAADRFVRAAYYLQHLPVPHNQREAIAGVLSVMRNIAQPFGVADPARPNISQTIWRTVSDLTDGVYFFESSFSPNIVWTRMDQLDFRDGAGFKKLDMANDFDRVGNVSSQFVAAEPFAPLRPDVP